MSEEEEKIEEKIGRKLTRTRRKEEGGRLEVARRRHAGDGRSFGCSKKKTKRKRRRSRE